MANLGVDPMPVMPEPCALTRFWWERRKSARVVHSCPLQFTNWRSSLQIGQSFGGLTVGSYCVPQVVQIHALTASLIALPRPLHNVPRAHPQIVRQAVVETTQIWGGT